MLRSGSPTGGSGGDSPIGGSGGDSPIGGSGGDSPIGGGSGTTSNCCCPTIIGPIVFTGCGSGSGTAASTTPTLTLVDIKSVLPPAAGPRSGPHHGDAFTLQSQQEIQWCWAAVAVSINDFLDVPGTWTQTRIAARVLKTVCDAVPNPNDPCDKPYSLDEPLALTGNLHKPSGSKFDQFVSFADLQTYWAAADLPICVRIAWDDGSGRAHFIVLTGCTALPGGQQLVTVYDPSPNGFGPAQWDYDLLRLNYQGPPEALTGSSGAKGHWSDSYFVQPQP